ncbi:MAG: glycosyl transferase, partial [Bacteroidota bacterium]
MQLPRWLLILILVLIPLAFLVNLGVQPFIDDEGNRATVALEMIWSGNFITPTLHGEYYYNKPPLWNWILALSMWIHGGASEWAVRFPAVLALWG